MISTGFPTQDCLDQLLNILVVSPNIKGPGPFHMKMTLKLLGSSSSIAINWELDIKEKELALGPRKVSVSVFIFRLGTKV